MSTASKAATSDAWARPPATARLVLADGTVIAQGGNIALPNSACMIGVVPGEGGSISGFAEIKVTC